MGRRNRGQFGTPHRAILEHYQVEDQAARILAEEHGRRHKPGERADLCPKCQELKRSEKA